MTRAVSRVRTMRNGTKSEVWHKNCLAKSTASAIEAGPAPLALAAHSLSPRVLEFVGRLSYGLGRTQKASH